MTRPVLVGPAVAVAAPESVPVDQRLSSLLDFKLLDEIGWDAATLIFRLPPEHPVVGWAKCRHPACSVIASSNPTVGGLCEGCGKRRESLHISTVDEYVATVDLAQFSTWARGEYLDDCKVTGCRRPSATARRGCVSRTWRTSSS